MRLEFVKYHGAGNDFILMDGRNIKTELSTENIARLCHRHFGIGADGLILLYPENADGIDYRMLYYNADGRESSMCGNGARCAFEYAVGLGLCGDEGRFIAYDGPHQGKFETSGDVTISMGDVAGIRRTGKNTYVLNTGSPHLVRFVADIETIDVFGEGRLVRNSAEFVREGINVNFVEILPDHALRIRTYERGVEDITLACGTGVTAAALAFADRQGLAHAQVPVIADGGRLSVRFQRLDGRFAHVFLTGPVQRVFTGYTDLPD